MYIPKSVQKSVGYKAKAKIQDNVLTVKDTEYLIKSVTKQGIVVKDYTSEGIEIDTVFDWDVIHGI